MRALMKLLPTVIPYSLLRQIEQALPGSDPWAQRLEALKSQIEPHV